MRFEEIEIGAVTLVTVNSDIIGSESRRMLVDHVRALLVTEHLQIVLDLGGVRHVDSRGLGELIECYRAAEGLGGVVKLLGVNRRLSDLLVITKLVNVFECFEAREDAIASFGPVPVPVAVAR